MKEKWNLIHITSTVMSFTDSIKSISSLSIYFTDLYDLELVHIFANKHDA